VLSNVGKRQPGLRADRASELEWLAGTTLPNVCSIRNFIAQFLRFSWRCHIGHKIWASARHMTGPARCDIVDTCRWAGYGLPNDRNSTRQRRRRPPQDNDMGRRTDPTGSVVASTVVVYHYDATACRTKSFDVVPARAGQKRTLARNSTTTTPATTTP